MRNLKLEQWDSGTQLGTALRRHPFSERSKEIGDICTQATRFGAQMNTTTQQIMI